MGRIIGIDLGTTNSCMAFVENERGRIIPNALGNLTTPSTVAFSDQGDIFVGEEALAMREVPGSLVVTSVKRKMGTDEAVTVGDTSYQPQQISGLVLKKLKEDAEAFLGETVTEAVITVPAYFDDLQRNATRRAGELAGLHVRHIINEPTAAALAYGLEHAASRKLLVYDLGGGTLDVSVVQIQEQQIRVLSTCGDNHLGGDDFDRLLAEYMVHRIEEHCGCRLDNHVLNALILSPDAQECKIALSEVNRIEIPYRKLLNKLEREDVLQEADLDTVMIITRGEFELLTQELVKRTELCLRNALDDAKLSPRELDQVILVGGSTRMPAIQELVYRVTGIIPDDGVDPDQCVASGAASKADELTGGSGVRLLDVTSMTLSVESVDGVATCIIPRNTIVPAAATKVFTTSKPFQRSVDINVLQGERFLAADNRSIGKFRLSGIQFALAGKPRIEVTFNIDMDGILQVWAKDLKTGQSRSVVLTTASDITDEMIHDSISRGYEDQVRLHNERNYHQIKEEAFALLNRVDEALTQFKKDRKEGRSTPAEEELQQLRNAQKCLRQALTAKLPSQMRDGDLENIRTEMRNLNKVYVRVRN